MLIQPEEGGKESYDRFRGRLMIPIRDPRGRVIALRRPHPRRRRAQISQLARHAALRQGPHALQPRPRRPGQPRRQAADRGRRLYGRDRARPRRHRRGRRAQRHRASPRPSSSACGGSIPRRSCASTATAPGRRRRSAPRSAPCPMLGPDRTLRFVELPAGPGPGRRRPRRRPRGVRSAARQPRAARRAPVAPRARGRAARPRPKPGPGLSQRLIDHAATIGRPGPRRIYREDWLSRFDEQRRPRRASSRAASAAAPRQRSRTAASRRPSRPSATRRAPSPPAASTRRPPAR